MKKVFSDALVKSIPVMAGYIVLGIGFGILMNDSGFGIGLTFAMSLLIYAGSLQFVGVGLMTGGVSLVTAAATSLIVNARHLFYSISMYTRYKELRKSVRWYTIFALTDETYSLLCDGEVPEGDDPDTFRFLVSLMDHFYWVLGSVIGGLLGPHIPFDTAGIDFSMTALFIGSFVAQWQSSKSHISAVVGVAASVVCLLLFGKDNFLIPAMLVMTLILSFVKEKGEEN